MKHQQMQQKFVFESGADYIAQMTMKYSDGDWWPSILKVNLSEIKNQINKNYNNTEIKDDQDAINRVMYNINHEFLHLAQHMTGNHNSKDHENHIYRMIGNGGNSYFNYHYKINKNPTIDSLTK